MEQNKLVDFARELLQAHIDTGLDLNHWELGKEFVEWFLQIKLEDIDNGTDSVPMPETSNHPVLTNLKTRIAELEAQNAKLDTMLANEVRARQDRETYTQEAFASAIQSGYDKETVVYLAYELDVELTETKTYTVQVEFQVEATVELGEELEAYTLDAEINGVNVNDYTYEITSIDEN